MSLLLALLGSPPVVPGLEELAPDTVQDLDIADDVQAAETQPADVAQIAADDVADTEQPDLSELPADDAPQADDATPIDAAIADTPDVSAESADDVADLSVDAAAELAEDDTSAVELEFPELEYFFFDEPDMWFDPQPDDIIPGFVDDGEFHPVTQEDPADTPETGDGSDTAEVPDDPPAIVPATSRKKKGGGRPERTRRAITVLPRLNTPQATPKSPAQPVKKPTTVKVAAPAAREALPSIAPSLPVVRPVDLTGLSLLTDIASKELDEDDIIALIALGEL